MPTEKSIKVLTAGILNKLNANNIKTVELIANASTDIAKQANLYAMMNYNPMFHSSKTHTTAVDKASKQVIATVSGLYKKRTRGEQLLKNALQSTSRPQNKKHRNAQHRAISRRILKNRLF